MVNSQNTIPTQCDVAIIGGGPSGLSAATELKKLGVKSVVVLEREASAGGIPRHCGHSLFGMREFKRVLSGAKYTKKLVASAERVGVIICLNTTVASIAKACNIEVSSPAGLQTITASKVICATGMRETPRSARLVSGQRPLGVVTTGALQSTLYLKRKKLFKHPVIIGTELVSFSALLSCLQCGSRPIAMLEQNSRISAKWGMQFLAAFFRVPIYYNTQLKQINGKRRVDGIEIQGPNIAKTIACDGVVFSGQFVAESSLLRMGHLELDKVGNPVIDQFGRCSDPDYFATGNMTHPVATAGQCWRHGIKTARQVFAGLSGELDQFGLRLKINSPSQHIKYCTPQLLAVTAHIQHALEITVRTAIKGQLSLKLDGTIVSSRAINTLAERCIELPLASRVALSKESTLELCLEGD